MTNFRIYIPKSRPYWSQRAISTGAGAGCAEGRCSRPGVPGDTVTHCLGEGLGPGNTNPWTGGWGGVVPGIATLPVPTYRTTPGTHRDHRTGAPECTNTRFEVDQGDPRGGILHGYIRGHAMAVSPLAPPYAIALRPAPWRLLEDINLISQYISVYLSYISVFQDSCSQVFQDSGSQVFQDSVLRYISVYLSYISVY